MKEMRTFNAHMIVKAKTISKSGTLVKYKLVFTILLAYFVPNMYIHNMIFLLNLTSIFLLILKHFNTTIFYLEIINCERNFRRFCFFYLWLVYASSVVQFVFFYTAKNNYRNNRMVFNINNLWLTVTYESHFGINFIITNNDEVLRII